MFDQPELEAHPAQRTSSSTRTRHPPRQHRGHRRHPGRPAGVRVDFTDRVTGGTRAGARAEYVLGCDGANSLVRDADRRHDAGPAASSSAGSSSTWPPTPTSASGRACTRSATPSAPATYMRIGQTRYRWEFRLPPGETADDYRDIARLHPLIAPWTGTSAGGRLEIVRVAEYTFRAQVADRWRDRRVFLLGDAAHLTPPFIGQGMGAGLRDAANLAWKLAGVLAGDLPETVLDTYQTERKPHARALIRLAKLVGAAMTAGGELGNLLRRVLAPRMHLRPRRQDQRILNSETPAAAPLRPGAAAAAAPLAGRPAVPERAPRRRPPVRRRGRGPVRARHVRRAVHHPTRRDRSGAAASSSRPVTGANCTAGCATVTRAPPSSAPTAPCSAPAVTCPDCAPRCRRSPLPAPACSTPPPTDPQPSRSPHHPRPAVPRTGTTRQHPRIAAPLTPLPTLERGTTCLFDVHRSSSG